VVNGDESLMVVASAVTEVEPSVVEVVV
jgi:hypothetical protein